MPPDHAQLKQPAAAGRPLLLDVLLDDATLPARAGRAQAASSIRLLHTMGRRPAPYGAEDDSSAGCSTMPQRWAGSTRTPCRTTPRLPVAALDAAARCHRASPARACPPVADPADPKRPVDPVPGYSTSSSRATATDVTTSWPSSPPRRPNLPTLVDLDTHLGLSTPDLSAYHAPAAVTS